ncbi:MAG: hypothetical protein OZ921_12390 [Sorangiineae bacterium]|nr:hypothetical protein [Polyangiaceae bacterium]MEB2323305.1 hypothetical protein [Sorangiineae bacterium]
MTAKLLVVGAILLAAAGCDKQRAAPDEQGAAPPPIESSKPGVCASGGGTVTDAESAGFFPRAVGDYCIDPNGETRAYGEGASGTLDKVCTELFDGECEVYKSYGLERVVTLRYVDGKGSPGSVSVNLSRFATKDGAYGFFTKRVVADADPAENAPASLDAGGAGALGTGIAYVWRGLYVAELSYTNEVEPPEQLKASSNRILPGLSSALGSKLSGDGVPPAGVAALPAANRVAMGISYDARDVLGVAGTGPGAVGYYKDGSRRWRVVSIVRADEDSAKDVMKTLKKLSGAQTLKGTTFDAVSFGLRSDDSSPRVEWVFGRLGARVVGIGDEEAVLGQGAAAEEQAKVALTAEQKLELLKRLVAGEPKQ